VNEKIFSAKKTKKLLPTYFIFGTWHLECRNKPCTLTIEVIAFAWVV
jgi:hypothetical protein